MDYITPRDRPKDVPAITYPIRLETPHSGILVILGILPDEEGKEQPFELFVEYSGEEFAAYDPEHLHDNRVHLDAISRLVSLCLRSRIDPNEIIKQLAGFTCHPKINGDRSIPDGISRILREFVGPVFSEESGEHEALGFKGVEDATAD